MASPLATISIVSHGQGQLARALLRNIEAHCGGPTEVIVTVNVPEDEEYLAVPRKFPVRVIRNAAPQGFARNHNNALSGGRGDLFVVCNPDITMQCDPMPAMRALLARERVAIAVPRVISPSGATEDSARRFPTPGGLIRRNLLRRRVADYSYGSEPLSVDWAAGMFMAMRRETFVELDGFDERYHLYFEDVDLCRRARTMGRDVMLDPRVTVIHDARRHSHRKVRYLWWHLASATSYFWGSKLARASRWLPSRGAT